MNIDEAIEILDTFKFRQKTKNYNKLSLEDIEAAETLINEYNNLKQIEEAHRIENGELREKIKQLEDIDSHIPRID